MIFVSAGLMNSVTNCKMQTGFQSDHSFVVLDINLSGNKKGPGYWKFNNSYLYDKNFINAAKAIMEESQKENNSSPVMKWELLKGAFIEFSKKYGRDKNKDRNKRFEEIEEQLDRIKDLLENLPFPDLKHEETFDNLKKERQEILQIKINGAQIRSREKFYSEGERSSKYFFSLEKHNCCKKIISRLRQQNQIVTQKQEEILEAQADFYRKLFRSNKSSKFSLVNVSGPYDPLHSVVEF